MVRFAGYAKKSEPKWPYVGMAFLAIVAMALVLFAFSLAAQWLEAEINKPVTTTVSTTTTVSSSTSSSSSSTTTTTLKTVISQPAVMAGSNGLKVTQIEIKSGEDNRLYCYTSFENAGEAQAVRHVWTGPGGRTVAVDLTARGGSTATWSYINITGQRAGQWQVVVETRDGAVLAEKSFTTN